MATRSETSAIRLRAAPAGAKPLPLMSPGWSSGLPSILTGKFPRPSMGEVSRARDTKLDRDVALKV